MSEQPRKQNGQFGNKTVPVPQPSPKLPTAFDKYADSDEKWTVQPQVRRMSDGEIIATLSEVQFSTRNNAEAFLIEIVMEYTRQGETYVTAWLSHPVYGSHLSDPMGLNNLALRNRGTL